MVGAAGLTLRQAEPRDFAVGPDETHSVRQLVVQAFQVVATEIVWEGKGVEEVGMGAATGTRSRAGHASTPAALADAGTRTSLRRAFSMR